MYSCGFGPIPTFFPDCRAVLCLTWGDRSIVHKFVRSRHIESSCRQKEPSNCCVPQIDLLSTRWYYCPYSYLVWLRMKTIKDDEEATKNNHGVWVTKEINLLQEYVTVLYKLGTFLFRSGLFFGHFEKLKARKTQPPKKLKAISCRITHWVEIFWGFIKNSMQILRKVQFFSPLKWVEFTLSPH